MEKEDTKKKEADHSTQRRHKGGLKFTPKVPKKDRKIIPKTEPQEENKALTIDKKVMSEAEKQGVSAVKLPKEHDEPLDYNCTDYPVTLPLRRPNSGNAEVLDEEEFGHSSGRAQDSELSAAEELDLMQKVDTPQLLFFQFPRTLPLPRQADPDAGTNMNMNAKSVGDNRKRRLDSIHGCSLKELPGGFMGKMLVYKSGKVKMTLGDVLFDVSAGSNCMFLQEVVVINTREKHCCGIGEIGKRAIVTPDIDSLLESIGL